MSQGSEPLARYPSLSTITGTMYLMAMPHRLVGDVEAVAGRRRGQDHHRRLAVAAVQRLHQVGLLGLGGQAGARARPLDVEDHERQLGHHGEPDALGLEREPGPLVAQTPMAPPNAAPMADATAAISSSAWKVRTRKRLCMSQLMQDVAGRRDRIGAVDDGEPAMRWAAARRPQASARLPVMLR